MLPDTLPSPPSPLSQTERSQVARGAASLFDCLKGRAQAGLSAPDARDVLRAWREAFSPGDAAAFARRLGWDGLDEAAALEALTRTSAGEETPEWTAWLAHFAEEAVRVAGEPGTPALAAERERVTPAAPPPFIEVFIALVRCARRALAAAVPQEGVLPAAAAALEQALVRELAGAGELALYQLFRDRPDGTGYAAFLHGLLEGGLRDVFLTYPVLARQWALLAASWVETTGELLRRLDADRGAMEATFATPLGDLARVAPGLSDRHHGGRRVAILTFGSGLRVVYKPREVGLERAYHGFLRWLGERGFPHPTRPLRVVERAGYGWVEWVDQEPFAEPGEVREYFRRAGALLAVTHVLRGGDLHQENVIATRGGPVVVDAEMMVQPVDRNEEIDSGAEGLIDGAAGGIPRSCLSSGLLTLLHLDGESALYDVGGLMPAAPRMAMVGRRVWHGLGTDGLSVARETAVRPALRNQVLLDGVLQRPEQYAAEMAEGLESAYRFVLAHRDALLAEGGPLAPLAAQQSRILFRPSDPYGAVVLALASPRYQKRGLDRSVALETLNRVFRHDQRRPRLWPLVADERQALEDLDVPRYMLPVTDHVLPAASGERVPGYLVRSGLDAVKAGLRALNEDDVVRQSDLVRSALATVPRSTDPARGDAASPWRSAAEVLGDEILARARRAPDGTLSWSRRQAPAVFDLYQGQAGTAVFLAALAAVTGAPRFVEAAEAALRPLAALPEGDGPAAPARWTTIGACSGLGSMVYALALAGRLLEDARWTAAARRWAREITPARIASDPHLDVAGGTAGALLALLAMREDTGLEQAALDERIGDCVRRLLSTQVPTGEGRAAWAGAGGPPLAGFAHGAAGIAYALARVYARTGDPALAEAVRRAHGYERGLFSPAAGNWPALRDGGSVIMTGWCHGAPGVGLARALGLAAASGPEVKEVKGEILAAMQTTAAAPIGRSDHLCCGNMGRSEALLAVGAALGEPTCTAAAEQVARQLAGRAHADGAFGLRTEGFEHRAFQPGFFRGLAGIGYQFLRTDAPSRLPSVLGFAWPPVPENCGGTGSARPA